MTTIAVLLVAALYAIALWMLVRRWHAGLGSGQFVLAVLPICLLFIAAPVPFGIGALVQAFRRVAQEGTGGLMAVAPFCVAILTGMRLGTLMCLAGLSLAAALQAFGTGDRPAADPPRRASSGAWWRVLILAAAPALAGPVVFLCRLARGITAMVLHAGSITTAPAELGQLTRTVSRDVVAAIAIGMISIVVLCGAGIGTVIAARSGETQDRLTVYSWAVLAVVVGWGAWLIVQVSGDIRAFPPQVP